MGKLKQRDVTRLNKKWKCTLPAEYVAYMKKYDPDEDVLEPNCFVLTVDGREVVAEGVMLAPLPTEGEDEIPGPEEPIETTIEEGWGGLHGAERPEWMPAGAIPIGGTMWDAQPLLMIEGPHAGEVWFTWTFKGKRRSIAAAKNFAEFVRGLVEAPGAKVGRIGKGV
jgi:hypothetical protein